MRTFLLYILLAAFNFQYSLAQTTSIKNVEKIDFRNIQAIKNGTEIVGYYLFYKTTDEKSGDSYYQLSILDKALKVLKENKLSDEKALHLIDAQYNLELICFKFYDAESKKVVFKFFNESGDLIGSKNYPVDLYASQLITLAISDDIRIDPSLYAIDEIGFLNYRWVKNEKPGFEIRFYPDNLNARDWTYRSNMNSTANEFATLLTANKTVIVNQITIQKGRLSKDVTFEISVLNTSTGRELFRTKLLASEFEESVLNAYHDIKNKEIKLFGMYYKKGESVLTSESIGLSVTTLRMDGTTKTKKYYPWDGEFKDLSKSDVSKGGYIFFHRIIRQENGEILAIGEYYSHERKGISPTTKILPSSNLGANAQQSFDILPSDFYLLKFDSVFKLVDVNRIENQPSKVSLPAGAGLYGPQYMAVYTKLINGFAFNYFDYSSLSDYRILSSRIHKQESSKQKLSYSMHSSIDYQSILFDSELLSEVSSVKVLPYNMTHLTVFLHNKKQKELSIEIK